MMYVNEMVVESPCFSGPSGTATVGGLTSAYSFRQTHEDVASAGTDLPDTEISHQAGSSSCSPARARW